MFKLYYFYNSNIPTLVFQNADLQPCLQFIASKNFSTRLCSIISPNNRRITFDANNDLVFGTVRA